MKFATLLGSIAVALFFVSTVESVGKYEFLDFIDPCPRTSPNITMCLRKSVETFIERLRNGLPKLGFPEVEPLIIPHLNLHIDDFLYVFDTRFSNLSAWGVSKLNLTDFRVRAKPLKTQLHMNFTIPEIYVTAKIDSNGTVMTFSADKKGDYKATYKGITAQVFIGAHAVMRNGIKYLEPKTVKIDFDLEDGSNMAITNPEAWGFEERINNYAMSKRWRGLADAMKPVLIKKFVPMIKNFAKKIYDQTPYDAWIKDDRPNGKIPSSGTKGMQRR